MTGPSLVKKVVNWLRAGYPSGVPGPDRVPLLALLPFLFGELGIWIAAPVGDFVMLAVVAALLVWNARRHRLAWGLFRA